MRKAMLLIALTGAAALAQSEQRRANITGGDDEEGKCTIEVEVDGAAEIEVRGDQGRIRTLSGRPARWVRFQCNRPMPSNPGDFDFDGIDGRGSQTLVTDPRGNRGIAVVRIEDPSGGSEGYTFDLKWEGGSAYSSTAPLWRGRNNRYQTSEATELTNACEDAVRQRANQRYGAHDVQFLDAEPGLTRGRGESYTGRVELQRGGRWQSFRYSCSVNRNTGRVRAVDLAPE
jgi:hypothetical protein